MKTIPTAAFCGLIASAVAFDSFSTPTDAQVDIQMPTDHHTIQAEYFKFMARYGKSLASKDQMDRRFGIFKSNYIRIKDHNESIDGSGNPPPFVMAVNEFADQTDEELLSTYSGGAKPKRSAKKLEAYKPPYNPFAQIDKDASDSYHQPLIPFDHLPSYKNWYEENMVTKPYAQGSCGACWAFAATSTLESLAMISGTEPSGKLQQYSVQQLVDCDDVNFGCTGGWMFDAYAYVKKNGIMLKDDYNMYVARKQDCIAKRNSEFHYKNTGFVESDNMTNEELKQQLNQQTIGVAIVSTGMLFGYSHGVVTESFLKCSDLNREVNHGVTLVGYGKVTNEVVRGHCSEYWIVRNSWGATWGENGFFKMCMDGAGDKGTELGTCHVNEFATWPTI